jgi:hypothetical protein
VHNPPLYCVHIVLGVTVHGATWPNFPFRVPWQKQTPCQTLSDLAALTEATGQTPDFWLRSEIGKHKSLRAPFVFVLRSP